MYVARIERTKTGKATERGMPSADLAARNLLILMKADGWQGDDDQAIDSLVNGVRLHHKGFVYEVVAE